MKGEVRVISNSSNGKDPLFTVQSNVTLVLDRNITLDGNKKAARLVRVEGGAFTMKAGSTLRGSADGGVFVEGGSFTMSDGTISGNRSDWSGGGVFVYSHGGGTFAKKGGRTIDYWKRDSPAGPEVNMDTRVSGRAGGWE
ncbi:MAG: hypothetical protein LBB80_03195 [Treponema sp.]|nr:hypothetical protein [Treponema sp.]